jgi:dTDP-4-amino-4,6-dideoxygalactose transaminase
MWWSLLCHHHGIPVFIDGAHALGQILSRCQGTVGLYATPSHLALDFYAAPSYWPLGLYAAPSHLA